MKVLADKENGIYQTENFSYIFDQPLNQDEFCDWLSEPFNGTIGAEIDDATAQKLIDEYGIYAYPGGPLLHY